MTVWELLADALGELPERFGRQDVLRWFAAHHPEVNPSTVSTHLQFATSNAPADSRGIFANRKPLVTRIGRGEYVAFQPEPGTTRPCQVVPPVEVTTIASRPAPSAEFDIVLVSCGRAKQHSPTRAADLYTSDGFQKRRAIAEVAGGVWFILSAEHGLVAPDEWVAPYDLPLASAPWDYRAAWGRWVAARLAYKMGGLRGKSILVLAPAPYSNAFIGHLEEAGATVVDPLAGLRQGEQGGWLASEVRRRGIADRQTTHVRPVPEPSATLWVDRHAVVTALLDYRKNNEKLHPDRLGYAYTLEADELLQVDPFAFLVGVIFDEGIKSERAWQGPLELKRRLGHLDPCRLRGQANDVLAAVAARPALHRFTKNMASAVVMAADRVCSVYDGDAGRLWAKGSTATEVDARFREFHQVGAKKAAMAVELLVSHFGVDLAELSGSNVAYDVHVRRVFLRSGLVDRDDIGLITDAARELNPARPGLLDLPSWMIGRRWCHATAPNCPACPLRAVCSQFTGRSVR